MSEQVGTRNLGRSGDSQRYVIFGPESLRPKADEAGAELMPLAAAAAFEVQGGPAAVRTIYITHPASPGALVPFAEYDEKLAQDKLNEALRIFNTLGASHIITKAYRGRSKSVAARAEAGVKGAIQLKRETSYDVAYEQIGTGGPASDPRPIAYPQEPGFEAACQAVLSNGARSTKIEITKESQFSITGTLGKRFKKFGFELGIEIASEEVRTFVVEATFGPLPKSDPPIDSPVPAAEGQSARSRVKRFRASE